MTTLRDKPTSEMTFWERQAQSWRWFKMDMAEAEAEAEAMEASDPTSPAAGLLLWAVLLLSIAAMGFVAYSVVHTIGHVFGG